MRNAVIAFKFANGDFGLKTGKDRKTSFVLHWRGGALPAFLHEASTGRPFAQLPPVRRNYLQELDDPIPACERVVDEIGPLPD